MPDKAPSAPPPGDAAPSKRRVLLAEDNESNRKHLKELLESDSSLLVETAANGGEALQALSERPYSMLITDLKMPHVSGMQLLEEVQKRRLPVAVIVTTGFGSVGDAVQAMKLGATDFLTKPVDF